MARRRSLSLLLAVLGFLTVSPLFSQESAPAARVVDRINDSQLVVLKGNTHPLARPEFDRGKVSADLRMSDLILVLSRSAAQQAAFDQFVTSQYDPASPNFHQWLEPEQVGEKFGPAQADLDAVSAWLRGHGFTVDDISRNRLFIRFSGNAAQVQSAFHTEMHNLLVKGEKHIANMSDPQIPGALAPVVIGVKSLHNFFPHPLHRLGNRVIFNSSTGKWDRLPSAVAAQTTKLPKTSATGKAVKIKPQFGTVDGNNNQIEDIAPYDFATIYNVLPAWNAKIDGTGQTVAIVGRSNIRLTDVATFRSAFGLPANVPQVIVAHGTDPGPCTGSADPCTLDDQIENALDVEWSGAVAKAAKIVLVTSGYKSASDDQLWDSADYVINHNTAPVMNVSYGECEMGMGSAGNAAYYAHWQTAAAQGIAVFVATGDSGSPACDQGGDSSGTPYAAEYGLAVSGLATTPYNTAVGGTDFNSTTANWSTSNNATTKASALGYIPETPWNSTCSNPLLVANFNSQLGKSYSATEICDYIDQGEIYEPSDLSALYPLVDTIGGGGGKSGCVVSDGSTVASCTGTSNSGVTLYKDGYVKPAWQKGVAGIPADGVRDIPDVSFFASSGFNGSAYLICVSDAGTCSYSASSEPGGEEVGGTSVASPAMAGVMALINQKAGSAQGNPNSSLYLLAAKQTYSSCKSESVSASSTACYFNDVDSGTNAMPCDYSDGSPNCAGDGESGEQVGLLTGYSATSGYDLATGLGSLNVNNVVNGWALVSAPKIAATPTFGVAAGTYGSTQTVAIYDTTGAAKIYYTAGAAPATPTSSSTLYSKAITVSASETIKAIAIASGYTTSAVASAAYVIATPAAKPTFSVAAGTYGAVQLVALADTTTGAVIHYTLGSAAPTATSPVYSTPIAVSGTVTINAIAIPASKSYSNSAVASATYVVAGSASVLDAPATSITTAGATVNAIVNTFGMSGPCTVQYGTSATALTRTTTARTLAASTSAVSVALPVTGLTTKTTYYYRVQVSTSGGISTGAILSFKTN